MIVYENIEELIEEVPILIDEIKKDIFRYDNMLVLLDILKLCFLFLMVIPVLLFSLCVDILLSPIELIVFLITKKVRRK